MRQLVGQWPSGAGGTSVRPYQHPRTCHEGSHILLRHRGDECACRAAIGHKDRTKRVDRITAPSRCHIRDGAAYLFRARLRRDSHRFPGGNATKRVEAMCGYLGADAVARGRVGEPQ